MYDEVMNGPLDIGYARALVLTTAAYWYTLIDLDDATHRNLRKALPGLYLINMSNNAVRGVVTFFRRGGSSLLLRAARSCRYRRQFTSIVRIHLAGIFNLKKLLALLHCSNLKESPSIVANAL